jgi:hypothetical protein
MSTIDNLLECAKSAIERGETSMRDAAEYIAKAQEQGATQRVIAERVGKSAAWVNQLLKWRAAGYGHTAFGPAKAAQRAVFRLSEQTKKSKPRSAEQEEAERAKARAQQAKADAAKAKADAAKAKSEARRAREEARRAQYESYANTFARKPEIHSGPRTQLVKVLGMLGSERDGEVLNAARHAERLRRKLNASWDELIIAVSESRARAA